MAAPLEQLSAVAAGIGQGQLETPHPSGVPEIDDVADSVSQSAHRVERTLARERAFSADASHQLRTPLAGLRLQLETALEGPDAKIRQAVGTAIGAADRLERTMSDLLALSRDTPAGNRELPVSELLEELRRDPTRQRCRGGAAPERSRPARSARRRRVPAGDPSGSRRAARQRAATRQRHGHAHAREAAEAIAVDVADEGRIDTPDQLFVRRSASAAGHGIGLALARSLTEAEGGRLVLSRREPTTFTVLLPLLPARTPVDARQAD